jgi:hypothetical protein
MLNNPREKYVGLKFKTVFNIDETKGFKLKAGRF